MYFDVSLKVSVPNYVTTKIHVLRLFIPLLLYILKVDVHT